MRRRKEQYTHGRLRKYVQTKKRKMKIGEALVGMKRRGSQLRIVSMDCMFRWSGTHTSLSRTYCLMW